MSPARTTLVVLGVLGVVNLLRGSIHVFLPDSGAGVIAGFDLTQNGAAVVMLLGVAGVGQLGASAVDLLVATRYRAMAVPLLLIEIGKTWLTVLLETVTKPPPVDIPGRPFAIGLAVALTAAGVVEFARPARRSAKPAVAAP